MTLFQQLHVPSPHQAENLQNENTGFAHFAGVFNYPEVNCIAFHASAVSQLGTNPWILDSGAINHMTPHKYLLHNLLPLATPFLITLPNGYKAKVISTGSLHLRSDMTLHIVLLVFFFPFQSHISTQTTFSI